MNVSVYAFFINYIIQFALILPDFSSKSGYKGVPVVNGLFIVNRKTVAFPDTVHISYLSGKKKMYLNEEKLPLMFPEFLLRTWSNNPYNVT